MLSVSARLKGLSLSPLFERWLLFRMCADGFIWSCRQRKRNVPIMFVVRKIFNQLHYQHMPDIGLQNGPQDDVLLTNNTVNIFYLCVLLCNYPVPWRQNPLSLTIPFFPMSLPLNSTSKNMHRDTLNSPTQTPRKWISASAFLCCSW